MADKSQDFKEKESLFSASDLIQFIRPPDINGHLHRPPSSYNLFYGDCLKKINDVPPSLPMAVISPSIGKMWHELDPVLKNYYFRKAKAVKEIHKQEYPDFWLEKQIATKKKINGLLQQTCTTQNSTWETRNFQTTSKMDKSCQTDEEMTKFYEEIMCDFLFGENELHIEESQREPQFETSQQGPQFQNFRQEPTFTESQPESSFETYAQQMTCNNVASAGCTPNLEQTSPLVQVINSASEQLSDNSVYLMNL